MIEVVTMWLVFAIFLALWVLGIELYFPVLVILLFFVAALASAGVAMLPSPKPQE